MLKYKWLTILFVSFSFATFSSTCLATNALSSSVQTSSIPITPSLYSFKTTLKEEMKSLKSTITLNVPNFKQETYCAYIEELPNITGYHLKVSTKGSQTILELNLTYMQSYRLTQAISNPSLLSKLNADDLSTYKKAQELINQLIKPTMTDFEKELVIHDYLINHFSYDLESYSTNQISATDTSISKAFSSGKALCQGYSEMTKLLLNLCQVPCEIVIGTSKNTPHAWNVVKINNEWYMLDVTWDDPIAYENNQRIETLSYDYFNLTNEQLSKTHHWNTNLYPIATATTYNYFVSQHKVIKNYSEFKNFVTTAIKNGETDILCYVENYNATTYDLNFIFNYYKGHIVYYKPDATSGSFRLLLNP